MKKREALASVSVKTTQKGPAVTSVSAKMVEAPFPFVEIRIEGPVTEDSVAPVFARVRDEIVRHQPKKVLVDLRQSEVMLTISDMHGLAKMATASLVGSIDKLALVARAQDILPEKFLEPSLINRGLPTLVTADLDEAVYWLGARFKPAI
jgi:hypothetical protein